MKTELARAMAAVLAVVALAGGCTAEMTERQREVAERGAQVMPFDLDRTTHTFTKNRTGGVQTVTADSSADTDQLPLIREHLRAEAEAFAEGDFGDPASIHGADMPGLAELRAGHAKIEVGYERAPDGARITYRTADRALVDALHRWFDAQVSDHGSHAGHS